MSIAASIRRNFYEGKFSLVLGSEHEMKCYKINPLEASAAAKNKSKDIHLPSIDVSFGSNRIL